MKIKRIAKELGLGIMALALAAGVYTGCDVPDPAGEFEKFGDRTAEDRVVADMSINNGQQVDFSGTFLLGIVTPLLETPIMLETVVSVDENFSADFEFQPIKTDITQDGTPREDARTPVGDVIAVSGVQVEPDGSFEVDLGEVAVAGDANPISGSDILANIQLQGVVQSMTFFCGTASGNAIEPIMLPLAGSTFGAVELEGATITDIEPVGSCAPSSNNEIDMGMGDDDMGGDDMGADMGIELIVDACVAMADQDIINDEMIDQSEEARSCGLANIAASDPVAESQTCIIEATGLSEDCAFCYAETVGCSIDNCVAPCAADAAGADCRLCQEDNGCITRFEECSGESSALGNGCTGEDDLAVIDDMTVDQDAEAATCASDNSGEDEPIPATRECIGTETGLSPLCSNCFAKFASCSLTLCDTECSADPSSMGCEMCQVDNGCTADFDACSGLMN